MCQKSVFRKRKRDGEKDSGGMDKEEKQKVGGVAEWNARWS
jgi:hypothetical protein